MAEATSRERLQPSLLDRLNDNAGSIARQLRTLRERLFERLNEEERQAFADLANAERRGMRPLTREELQRFARHDDDTLKLLHQVFELEQQHFFELRQHYVISLERLKECVLRDLGWLFNCDHLESATDLSAYPYVQNSVVNFGIPSLAGRTVSALEAGELERAVRQALLRYEPRLKPDSVQVKAAVDSGEMGQNALLIEVDGQLWAEPAPLRLLLQTLVDLEDGLARVEESVD
jgi:type VI secretion system protein ImpF